MNNNKEPEKIEFKNNKRDTGKILTIVFFTLAVLIILVTLLLVYTPLKDILFKNPITEETKTIETEETASEIITEETIGTTTEKTSGEPTKKEEPTEEKTTDEEIKEIEFQEEARYIGVVKDIDYEKKVITIENERTGEIEVLDNLHKWVEIIRVPASGEDGMPEKGYFEDIKGGNYIILHMAGESGQKAVDFFGGDPSVIIGIHYSEDRWWREIEQT